MADRNTKTDSSDEKWVKHLNSDFSKELQRAGQSPERGAAGHLYSAEKCKSEPRPWESLLSKTNEQTANNKC